MCNPLPVLCREGLRLIALVSLIVLLWGFPCFHDFSLGASHIPTSPLIQWNDFCTCNICFMNQVQCLQTLISAGCDLTITDTSGDTPLHVAKVYAHKDCQDLIGNKLTSD